MSTRDEILKLLEENRGAYISGESVAESLGVTRNAVWKAVTSLKEEGHRIGSVRKKGYILEPDSDVISLQGISPFLLYDEALAGKIHIYSELASTNVTAKEMAVSGDFGGHIVIADRQTSGRGRRGREFFSPAGGIYISFIIKPEDIYGDKAHLFTLAAAVASCEAIEEAAGLTPGIKWINDILLHGRKVGGILTESALDMESGAFQWVVVGIGINFNMPRKDFPAELQKRAGSLFPEGDAPVTRNRLIGELINKMSDITDRASFENPSGIIDRYRRRLDTAGKRVQVFCAGESYPALALDIDDRGALKVKKDDGTIEVLSSGEVSLSSCD